MPIDLPNLWPEDIGGDQDVVTPSAVLKQAAAQLGQQTRHLIKAKVNTSVSDNRLEHAFWIEVPSLEYRYKLFQLAHDVDSFYPLATGQWIQGRELQLHTEDELKEYLKNTFASEKTKKLVGTLLKQVRS